MRSFIAVKTSAEQKKQIAGLIADLRRCEAKVKWVEPENLHVTLKFLGEVEDRALPNMFDLLEKSLTNDTAFGFSLSSIGCFPNARNPRVVWVGIEQGAEELRIMSAKIDDLMAGFGFAKEKRGFSAHLTIGRVKDTRRIESLTNKFSGINFRTDICTINEVIFFQSILRPEGPTYIPHKVVKLKGFEKEG